MVIVVVMVVLLFVLLVSCVVPAPDHGRVVVRAPRWSGCAPGCSGSFIL